jgi:hypothetical protein
MVYGIYNELVTGAFVNHYEPTFTSRLGAPHCLVGGLEHVFFHILGMSSSQLTFIFFRGVGIPPTSCTRSHHKIEHRETCPGCVAVMVTPSVTRPDASFADLGARPDLETEMEMLGNLWRHGT